MGTRDSSQNCLCLYCRQKGHVVEECPRYIWKWERLGSVPPPDVETARPSHPLSPFPISKIEESTQALCQRCSQLDALSRIAGYHPFVPGDYADIHSEKVTKKKVQIPSLGPIRSLRLLSTCPLCRLLFDISELVDGEMDIVRSGGELTVVTAWTIHRLENELVWKGYRRGKGPYAKCVHTCVTKDWPGVDGASYVPNLSVEHEVDAIGLIDIGGRRSNDTPALGLRQVDPKTPDYCSIKDWLRRCDDLHHITCRPLVSDGLTQIKLVHVETRQIVMHPGDCDYIALSYVWGGVEQPSYKLGEILPTIPATLEDAMVVTRNLGKHYLWADSLCIDQENSVEKAAQIALMSAIYSGAWATIICLSGQSAQSGIPRVGTLEGVVPQLSCDVWGKRFLSVMPTLHEQIIRSPWASRAWTYQEGLLSPRRLFFTNHQVYFECNSVQCCESLDDSNSPFHLTSDEERLTAFDEIEQDRDRAVDVIGRGVFRDPFRPISSAAPADVNNFTTYERLVQMYTEKKMSHDADSLNAFSAMLTRLGENYYKGGFVEGLPVGDLPRAMLWFHIAPPRRRVGFAAWSWAGWEGSVYDTSLHGNILPEDAMLPPLRIWKAGDGDHPELIYNFNPTPYIIKEQGKLSGLENHSQDEEEGEEGDTGSWEDVEDSGSSSSFKSGYASEEDPVNGDYAEIDFRNDPVFRLAQTTPEEAPAINVGMNGNELLIEGIVIQADFIETPGGHYSDSETDDDEDVARCSIQLEGQSKRQRMRFHGHNATQMVNQRSGNQQEFLLMSRDHHSHSAENSKVYNSLLLIDRDGDVASRIGVASLRLDNVELLDSFKLEWRLLKLRS